MSGRLGMGGDMVSRGDKVVEVSKLALKLKPPTTSQKLMWGGSAAVAAGAPVASGRMRQQKDRKGAAVAGGAAGLAGTKLGLDLSGYGLREGIKHHVRRVDAGEVEHPLSRKQRRNVERDHRAKHGITSGTMQGAPMRAWRDFPTELPAGRLSRVMGWKNTPAVALGIMGAGAAAGAARGGRRRVQKSWIPGQGYVSASKMPRKQLRELAHGGRKWMAADQKMAEEIHSDDSHMRAASARAFMDEHGSFHSTKGAARPRTLPNKIISRTAGEHTEAFAMKTGGRRGPGAVYARPNASQATLAHEQAHITPKRSGYRLQQILNSPRKTMAEEARADYLSGQHYKSPHADESGYAQAARSDANRKVMQSRMPDDRQRAMFNRPSTTAYRNVQDRMQRAGTRQVTKVDTTMSDHEAHQLASRYDTRGPLPKGLSRDQKMKAYEARYIAAGGKKAEKWKRRADAAEVGRNIGLVGATTSAAALLASRGRRTGAAMARTRGLRHLTPHRLETAALGSALGGGYSELYGEHARSRRASYQNSPAGVAGSALSRMQAYTPGGKS